MEKQRKWAGVVILGVAVLLVGSVLVLNQNPGQATPSGQQTPKPAAVSTARTANASAIGYAGPVLVRLSLGENGVVEAVEIGGARFGETEGLGSRVRDESFVSQFIGRIPPFALGENIDAVSGATLSSQAAVDAVNDAAAFLSQ